MKEEKYYVPGGIYIRALEDDEWIEIGDFMRRLQIVEDKIDFLWRRAQENENL